MTNTPRLREEPQKQTHKWLYTDYRGNQLPPLVREPREGRHIINLDPKERGKGIQTRLTNWVRLIDPAERRVNGFRVKLVYWYSKQFQLDLERLIRLRYCLIERYPRGIDKQSYLDCF